MKVPNKIAVETSRRETGNASSMETGYSAVYNSNFLHDINVTRLFIHQT